MAVEEYAAVLEREASDSGYCGACGKHIDGRCECTEEEREDGPQGCTCRPGSEECTC